MRSRGSTLAMVLSAIALASVFSLALCSTAVFHLEIASTDAARRRARNVAESGIATAISRLLQPTPAATLPPRPFPQPGNQVSTAVQNDVACVIFGASGPLASVDNMHGSSSKTGPNGEPVPPYSMLLFARGQSGSEIAVVKTVVALPAFPSAIACAGPLVSTGGLQVGADAGADNTASIVSNASVSLDSGSVAGDVDCAGPITLARDVKVGGAVSSFQGPIAIPVTAAEGLDPGILPGVTSVTGASGDLPVNGFARSDQPLMLNSIALNNGVLYVTGSLTVGSIHGNGAVIATGSVTVNAAAQIHSDEQVALVADGDITLHGQDPTSSTFQGLVSTCGSFAADHITIHGLFVQAGASGKTTLTDVHVLHQAASSEIQIGVQPPPGVTPRAGTGWEGLIPGGSTSYPQAGADGSSLSAMPPTQELVRSGSVAHLQATSLAFPGVQVDSSKIATAYPDPSGNGYWGIAMSLPDGTLPDFIGPNGRFLTRNQMQPARAYLTAFAVYYKSSSDLGVLQQAQQLGYTQYWQIDTLQTYSNHANGQDPSAIAMINSLGTKAMPPGVPRFPAAAAAPMIAALDDTNPTAPINQMLDAAALRLRTLQQQADHFTQVTGLAGRTVFTVDINQFMSQADRARVLLWEEGSP